jgi:hypothetical protein
MKTFVDSKESFDRGRRASEQSFMVQNMTVKDGSQAIVGNVTPRSAEPTEEQSTDSPPRLPDARAVPLPRIEESPGLAPRSPVAEQGEVSARARQKMTTRQLRITGPMLSSPRCGARTRSGTPCRSPAVSGKRRCRMHGGAAGSGAPRGNKNALKRGAYTREAMERRKGIRDFIRKSRDLIKKM